MLGFIYPFALIIDASIYMISSPTNSDKMDPGIGRKADPFLLIRGKPASKKHKGQVAKKEITFHRTNVVKQSLNPEFDEFVLDVTQIGDLDTPFAVECWGTFIMVTASFP
jgi:Ca2+-dependent lipid-binding protein